MHKDSSDFYIGWQDDMPPANKGPLRIFVWVMSLVVIVVGAFFVLSQQPFSTSTFELGRITPIEGILLDRPVPFLQVYWGPDPNGKPVYQHIVLVGAGKHGAHQAIQAAEKAAGKSLDGQMLRINGSLIYHDGQTLLEISRKPYSITPLTKAYNWPAPPKETSLGQVTLAGEIIDPKCYFGAMKPGYGKTHRACAIRCIAGGIPPVFKTTLPDGAMRYYLMVGPEGQPFNDEVLPFVADQVRLQGELRQLGDWYILYHEQGLCCEQITKK